MCAFSAWASNFKVRQATWTRKEMDTSNIEPMYKCIGSENINDDGATKKTNYKCELCTFASLVERQLEVLLQNIK